MRLKEVLAKERHTRVKFRVQRNGVADRVNVEMGEELDVEAADSIEIIEVGVEVEE